MPEETIKDTTTQSTMIGFTLNSLALQAGLPVTAIVTVGMNMPADKIFSEQYNLEIDHVRVKSVRGLSVLPCTQAGMKCAGVC